LPWGIQPVAKFYFAVKLLAAFYCRAGETVGGQEWAAVWMPLGGRGPMAVCCHVLASTRMHDGGGVKSLTRVDVASA